MSNSKKTNATTNAAPRPERTPLPADLWFKVITQDKLTCRMCGWRPGDTTDRRLEVDHIIPVAAGGTDDMDNLQTLCSLCNRGKSAKLLEQSGQTQAEAEHAEHEARTASIQQIRDQYIAIAEKRNHEADQVTLSIDAVNSVFAVYTKGENLNIEERNNLARIIQEFGLKVVLESMDEAFTTYHDAKTVLERIGGFCRNNTDPCAMQRTLIKWMSNKLDGFDEEKAEELMNEGRSIAGFKFINDVKKAIKQTPPHTPWKSFATMLSNMVDEYTLNESD